MWTYIKSLNLWKWYLHGIICRPYVSHFTDHISNRFALLTVIFRHIFLIRILFFSLYFIASIWMDGEFIATTLEYNQFHFHHIIITHVVVLLFITLNGRVSFFSSPITVKCTVKLLLAIRPHWNFKPRGFQCRKIQMLIQTFKIHCRLFVLSF